MKADETLRNRALELLEHAIPFRFLARSTRLSLASELTYIRFAPGEVMMHQGDTEDKRVLILISGRADVFDRRAGHPTGTVVEAGHYVGEWEPLFELPRVFEIRALQDVECFVMSGQRFLSLFDGAPAFAQAFGTILRDNQGIFEPFDRFRAEVTRNIIHGHLSIEALLPLYRAMEPALHPKIGSPVQLDLKALAYAVRRLPENITRTFAFLCTDEFPPTYGTPERFFPSVGTAARRRDIWEMLPGKNLVLTRNGLSDLLDLVTCLCLYSVEAQKLRHRLQKPENLVSLEQGSADVGQLPDLRSRLKRIREVIAELPFNAEEAEDLLAVWDEGCLDRLSDVLKHREMFSLDIRRHSNKYNSRRSELWITQLAEATRAHIGFDPSDLPKEIGVHIISSNTHSVSNCLNPWYVENTERVLSWARAGKHPLLQQVWKNEYDALYAVVRDYFIDDPARAAESKSHGRQCGIMRLEETASTGIQVQLIDTEKLRGRVIDPGIGSVPSGTRQLIVNIDYAFGEQAEHIIRNLLQLYGANVRSVSFLGKAGALVGQRGDILVPGAFIEQTSERFQQLPSYDDSLVNELKTRTEREVHRGIMLTAEGTLLQNRTMLQFYRKTWNCVGIEMEGAFYHRQVIESTALGVIPEDVRMRFFYYVSDLPLQTNFGLSDRLQAQEGVPPLYAITREIIADIFRQDSEREGSSQSASGTHY